MRILLISYHYPPDRAVGGLRALKVAEALRDAGHEVTVLAAGRRVRAGDVHRVPPLASIRDAYAHVRDSYRKMQQDPISVPRAPYSAPDGSPPSTWKRWLFSLIWLPDDKQGFITPAVSEARRLPGPRPELIYTTAPPFSVLLAGLLLKVLTGIPWVAEFRDPWTTNPWKPAYLRSAFSDWAERRLEWLCLERADLLVAVSDGIAESLAASGTRTPLMTARNGIEHLRTSGTVAPPRGGPFEIVHAGSFYHARDPFPFFDALGQLIADRALRPADLQVLLIGGTESYEGRSIADHLRDAGLQEHVRLEGWMEPDRCLRKIERADALLLFALDQPDQVPNKLYEYLGARRPILAVLDEHGETARMLREVGGHCLVVANEVQSIRRGLEDMLNERRHEAVGNPAALRRWTTQAQMEELVAAVARVGGERQSRSDPAPGVQPASRFSSSA